MEDMTKKELQEKAEGLGIDVKIRWSKSDLINAIDQAEKPEPEDTADAEPETPKPVTEKPKTKLKNISGQRWVAFSHVITPGEKYKPGKAELSNERDVKRVNRAVELGKLEWC